MNELNIVEHYIKTWVEKNRPPVEVRNELDLTYDYNDGIFILSEIRELFDGAKIKSPCAKATLVKKNNTWKLYWMRSNMKWYLFETEVELNTIFDVLNEIEKDEYGCFFG
jgi:hypothetical protein